MNLMLSEYQVNITIERSSGLCTCYILRLDHDDAWTWFADEQFGPFDTSFDICSWFTRKLSLDMRRNLR